MGGLNPQADCVCFLESVVCPLVGEDGLVVRQASLEGRTTPAHWTVDLGFGPLVGEAMFLRCHRGFRKSLGNLSTDELGCVPT